MGERGRGAREARENMLALVQLAPAELRSTSVSCWPRSRFRRHLRNCASWEGRGSGVGTGGGSASQPLKREIAPRRGEKTLRDFFGERARRSPASIEIVARVATLAAGEVRRDLILFHRASVACPPTPPSPRPRPLPPSSPVYFSRRNKIPAITYACSRQERRTLALGTCAKFRQVDPTIPAGGGRPGTQGAKGIFALSRYHPVCFVEGSD
jgi:hypothetical protein